MIQITGRKNYGLCGEGLGLDLIAQPELLEQTDHACRSAAWFWRNAKLRDGTPVDLNPYADEQNFLAVSKIVNIGLIQTSIMPNGYHDRLLTYERALKVLE